MHKALTKLAFLGLLCALGAPAIASEGLVIVEPGVEGVSAPYLIPTSRVSPDYPPAALHARYGAAVLLRATVLADGSVGGVEVLDSTRGKLGFEQAAMRAVKQWRFEPAQLEGSNVASYAWVRVRFNPPQNNASGGFVASDFPRDVAALSGSKGTMTLASLEASEGEFGARTMSDEGFKPADRVSAVKKPPCNTIGCVYSRSALFPPYIGGNQSPSYD
jgi:TonB family protein